MPDPDALLFDFSDSGWHFGLEGAARMAKAYAGSGSGRPASFSHPCRRKATSLAPGGKRRRRAGWSSRCSHSSHCPARPVRVQGRLAFRRPIAGPRTNGHTHHMQKVSLDALARQQIALAGSAGGGHTADTVFGGHEKVLRQTVEVVPGLVELEVAVPRLMPSLR